MDLRYRVEYICPSCEAEYQITCPGSTELCTCEAVLIEALSFGSTELPQIFRIDHWDR